MPLTYYDILGVGELATGREIRSRFRQLARQLHPDALPRASASERLRAEEAFKEIADAYRVLSHPELRARYDDQLHQYRTPPPPTPAPAWAPPPPAPAPAPRRKHRLNWGGGLGYALYLLFSGHMCSQPPPAPPKPTPAAVVQPARSPSSISPPPSPPTAGTPSTSRNPAQRLGHVPSASGRASRPRQEMVAGDGRTSRTGIDQLKPFS